MVTLEIFLDLLDDNEIHRRPPCLNNHKSEPFQNSHHNSAHDDNEDKKEESNSHIEERKKGKRDTPKS